MPSAYWAMVMFAVLCMLAGPVGYRLLQGREKLRPGRRKAAGRLCAVLFCLGLLLLIALGLLYPRQNPILPRTGFFYQGPYRNV